MFTKLKQKIKNDKGNAVVVLGLMLIVVSLAVGGMMLDISKAYQFKSSYVEAAKKSTHSAMVIRNGKLIEAKPQEINPTDRLITLKVTE